MMTQQQIHEYVENTSKKRQEGVYKRKYTPEKLRVSARLSPEQYMKIEQSNLTITQFLHKAIDAYTIH